MPKIYVFEVNGLVSNGLFELKLVAVSDLHLVSPQEHFKNLLENTKKALSPRGFRKKGSTFFVKSDGNYGLINFQKSLSTTKDLLVFTMNVGVISSKIASFYEADLDSPLAVHCHMKERLGFLLPEHRDKWWKVSSSINAEELNQEIASAIEQHALKYISEHISDEALMHLWWSKAESGHCGFQDLRFLSVLTRDEPREKHEKVLAELAAMATDPVSEEVAQIHIEKLESF